MHYRYYMLKKKKNKKKGPLSHFTFDSFLVDCNFCLIKLISSSKAQLPAWVGAGSLQGSKQEVDTRQQEETGRVCFAVRSCHAGMWVSYF